MSVAFLFLFKKNYKIDLSNYKNFLHLPEIKSGPDQVSGMGLFVRIVHKSITLLFSQEVPFLVFEYASSVSATISLIYGCLKNTLCCQIMSFDLFNVNF